MTRAVAFMLSLLLLFPLLLIPIAAEDPVTVTAGAGTVLAVPADIPQGKSFVGWGAEGVFLPAGATYSGEETVLTAVFVGISTRPAEKIRTETKMGLRFLTDINKADLAVLKTYTAVLFGTYITLADYVNNAGGVLTPAALSAAGMGYLETKTDKFYTETDTVGTVAGSLVDVQMKHYYREFQAAGYIEVTYTDGTKGAVIAPAGERVRLYDKAISAFADRTDAADGNHPNAVTYGGYSAYSNDQLTYFCQVMDCVVDVSRFSFDNDYNITYEFYGYVPVSYSLYVNLERTGKTTIDFVVKEGSAFRFNEDLYQVYHLNAEGEPVLATRYSYYNIENANKTLWVKYVFGDYTGNH